MNIDNSAWGIQCQHMGKREPVPSCPQPDPPVGHAVQYPVVTLAYYGPRSCATGIVQKDAAGQYWCDGKRFSHVQFALDYAEANRG